MESGVEQEQSFGQLLDKLPSGQTQKNRKGISGEKKTFMVRRLSPFLFSAEPKRREDKHFQQHFSPNRLTCNSSTLLQVRLIFNITPRCSDILFVKLTLTFNK